jgi:hypothetical protein
VNGIEDGCPVLTPRTEQGVEVILSMWIVASPAWTAPVVKHIDALLHIDEQ